MTGIDLSSIWPWLAVAVGLGVVGAVVAERRTRRVKRDCQRAFESHSRVVETMNDSLLQGLLGIAWHLEAAASLPPDRADESKTRILALLDELDQILQEARQELWDLKRNPWLREDFLQTLQRQAEALFQSDPDKHSLVIAGQVKQVSSEVAHALAFIAREAWTCMLGCPGKLVTTMEFRREALSMIIALDSDSSHETVSPSQDADWRIRAISRRAKNLGADLNVQVIRGINQTISVTLPALKCYRAPTEPPVRGWFRSSRQAIGAFDRLIRVPSDTQALRILIVDDHQIALEGLTALLNASPDFEVIAALSSGEEAVEQFASIRPDVTIMDLRLSGIDGIETIRRIRATHPGARFVVMTTFDGDENVYRALEAGASAYLLKDSLRQELFTAIKGVHAGRRHVTASVAAQLAENFPRVELTPRERDVLQLMASGMRNKEIAAELDIAEHTVKVHVQNILGKLGVSDRTEAVVQAFKRGFLHLR